MWINGFKAVLTLFLFRIYCGYICYTPLLSFYFAVYPHFDVLIHNYLWINVTICSNFSFTSLELSINSFIFLSACRTVV